MEYNGHNIDTPITKISEIPGIFHLQIGRKDSRVSKQLKEKVMLIAPYETCKD